MSTRSSIPYARLLGTRLASMAVVTVRITVVPGPERRCIRIEGHLTQAEIGELEQAIGDETVGTRLELENLRSADAAGLTALRRLRAHGVELCGVPPHLTWRIDADES
jgi:hypothetical protein